MPELRLRPLISKGLRFQLLVLEACHIDFRLSLVSVPHFATIVKRSLANTPILRVGNVRLRDRRSIAQKFRQPVTASSGVFGSRVATVPITVAPRIASYAIATILVNSNVSHEYIVTVLLDFQDRAVRAANDIAESYRHDIKLRGVRRLARQCLRTNDKESTYRGNYHPRQTTAPTHSTVHSNRQTLALAMLRCTTAKRRVLTSEYILILELY
jgi:hypothetical protein